MLDLAIGIALLIGSCVLIWNCRPKGGEMLPFLRMPGMEITVTLLFVTGISVGGALFVRGISTI